MKKNILLILLLVMPVAYGGFKCGDCDCNITSHSFFSVRPLYQSASPERVTLFRDRVHARENGWAGAIQLSIFGSETKKPSQLAAFFGPSCKPQLTVVSANNLDAGSGVNVAHAPEYRDIVAQDFNIYFKNGAIFESSFCLDARQTVIGLGINYKQGLHQRHNGKWIWFELSSPLTHVKNEICIHETVKSDGELLSLDVVGNMTEAFRQPSWKYGRIDPCCNRTETKFADLEIKLGYEWFSSDCCFIESYIGALAPTGNKPTGQFVFEPVVGHNGHAGAMCGSSGIFEWWRNDAQDFYALWTFDWNCLYLFEKIQMRSLDLIGKPWSRYMPVYSSKEEAQQAYDIRERSGRTYEAVTLHTPGINVFTQPICVKPRFAHTFNTALALTCKKIQAEVGYNVFARCAECVRLACCWQEGPALKSIDGRGYTNKVQTIDNPITCYQDYQDRIGQYDQNIITECDLDLESAAHPAMISHTLYGSVGCRWDERQYPCFIGTGFSYEFACDNAGLDRWVAWIKGGVSF